MRNPRSSASKLTPHARDFRTVLEDGRWFSSLPTALREQLLDAAVVRRVPAGTCLFSRGDANDGLYCIVEGAVRIGASSIDGRDAMLGMIEPPQWFGEIALFDGGPRTHNVDTCTKAIVIRVPKDVLDAWLAADPTLWRYLGSLVAEKIRAVFSGIEELALLPAPARIARRLLAIAQGYGMRAPGVSQRRVTINQEQLGAMLSLTRQTVSAVLRDMEAKGWVRRHYGGIELLDAVALARLGELAGSDALGGAVPLARM